MPTRSWSPTSRGPGYRKTPRAAGRAGGRGPAAAIAPPTGVARAQAPAMPAGGEEQFAANLGIFYQLVPYGDAFGARLTRPPAAGVPATRLQIPGGQVVQLE